MTKFLKAKERIDKFFAVVAKAAQVVAACFLCIMILAVSVQVVGRVCHFKIPVTEEIGTYSLIWMTYIASIAVIIKGEHLTVDLFLNRYKPATRRIVRLFVDVLVLIFCGMLMKFGYQLCQSPIILNGRTPALQMSRLYVYLSVPVAMTFSTAFVLYDIVVAIADIVFKGGLTDVENARKAAKEAEELAAQAEEAAAIRAAMLGGDGKEDK